MATEHYSRLTPTYLISADPSDFSVVIITDTDGRIMRIHREDADPEHRFTAYRLAAGWFGNLPVNHPDAEDNNLEEEDNLDE